MGKPNKKRTADEIAPVDVKNKDDNKRQTKMAAANNKSA